MSDPSDLDIDLGRFGRILIRNWWVIVLLALVSAAIGALIADFASRTYEASATVYLGQARDSQGNELSGLQNNPTAAAQLASSKRVLAKAARDAGPPITVQQLRRTTDIEEPPQVGRSSGQPANTILVNVAYGEAGPAARAANAMADALVEEIGVFAEQKITLLEDRIEEAEADIAELDTRSATAQAALADVAAGAGSDADKALAAAPYTAILQSVAQMRATVGAELQADRMLLLTAQDVEKPRVIKRAVPPEQTSGTDWRIGAAVGVLSGIVVGIIVAVVRDRRRQRDAVSG